MIRPRRDETTCGTRDISVPANVSVGQSAAAKLTPTTTKCERSIDHPTAISRQFAPSSPRKKWSTSSRRGICPRSSISFQRLSTRQTRRRSCFIISARFAGLAFTPVHNVRRGLSLCECRRRPSGFCRYGIDRQAPSASPRRNDRHHLRVPPRKRNKVGAASLTDHHRQTPAPTVE